MDKGVTLMWICNDCGCHIYDRSDVTKNVRCPNCGSEDTTWHYLG